MTYKLAPIPQQFTDSSGNPRVGAKLFAYLAGTTTKQATAKDILGAANNTNPIILNASGSLPYAVWLTEGIAYDFLLAPSTDSDPPTTTLWALEDVTGVNDTSSLVLSQWLNTLLTPTYISATSFSLSGDQRLEHHMGRRIKATVTAGTVYGVISSVSYSSGTGLTTVTVVLDSGALDAGLSRVDIGLTTFNNPSLPADKSVPLIGGYVKWSTAANALTVEIKALSGNDPSVLEPVYALFRDVAQASAPYVMHAITAALSMTVSSGSTLGTTSAEASRIRAVLIEGASGVALGVYNSWSSGTRILERLDESKLWSATAEGGAGAADSSAVIYATAAHTSKPIVEVSYMESTQTTAGTWAQTLDKQVTVNPAYQRTGDIVRIKNYVNGAVSSGSTVMVIDDTIPQITEGIDWGGGGDYTPKSAANLLAINAAVNISSSVAVGHFIMGLFNSPTADALAVSMLSNGDTALDVFRMSLTHLMVANSTSTLAFKVRAGCTSAGTTTFNGQATSRVLGGVLYGVLEIRELFV